MTPHDRSTDGPTIQFSLAAVFYAVTVAAMVCALYRLAGQPWQDYSNRGLALTAFGAALLVAACAVARRHVSSDLAWGLIALGWLVALLAAVDVQIRSLSIIYPPGPVPVSQAFLWHFVLSVALPLLLSIPAVPRAMGASRGVRSCGRKWVILAVVASVANVTVLMVFRILVQPWLGGFRL